MHSASDGQMPTPSANNYQPQKQMASIPTPNIEKLKSETMKGVGSLSNTTKWVNGIKKQANTGNSAPKLPKPVDLSKYNTNLTTIKQIEQKYGFDFSRNYAEQQAEAVAQSKKDQIETERERLGHDVASSKVDLQHDYFNKFLVQRQQLSNTGINAGIASEKNLQLDMSRQGELADILAGKQLKEQELDRNESTITKEEQAYAEDLYNKRLGIGFDHTMRESKFNQAENQWRSKIAMQQRQKAVDEKWREHQFNNMSYAERVKMAADAEKYGMDRAWEMHKFDAQMEFDSAKAMPGMSGTAVNGIQVTESSNKAYAQAQKFGLTLTSGHRTPAHNAKVGGSKTSKHVAGRAYDFAGDWNKMNQYAKWAKNSGMFGQVLWQVKGHYDHVHVSW